MKRLVIFALLLLLFSGQSSYGQESDGLKLSVQGAAPVQASKGKNEQTTQPLTNDSIVKLVKVGFSEDSIISMIEHQPGSYRLGVDDVIALKKAGVSEKAIEAMSRKMASEPTPAPKVPASVVASKAMERTSQRASPPGTGAKSSPLVPKEHGLYYQASNRLVPIEGQVISFARTGSLLSSAVTLGIKSAKANVQILGRTSAHMTVSDPVFYYRVAQATDAAGGAAGDLVLVRMSAKHNRRQFEVAARGAWRASQGISIRSQLQVLRKHIEPDLYQLTPAGDLKPGEYGFYMFRGYDLPGYIYDFTVE